MFLSEMMLPMRKQHMKTVVQQENQNRLYLLNLQKMVQQSLQMQRQKHTKTENPSVYIMMGIL